MAISTNGGSNPTSVIYNGKNVNEVWYKSSPSATAVQVWPDISTKNLTLCVSRNQWSNNPGETSTGICWDKTISSAFNYYSSKSTGAYTKGNIYELNKQLNNNSILMSTGGTNIGRVQFVIESSWTEQITVNSNYLVNFYYDNGKLLLQNNKGETFDVTSLFISKGWKGNLSQYKWIRFYRQVNNTIGGDLIIYFNSIEAPSWIKD